MGTDTSRELETLIGDIYGAALEPERWACALEGVRRHLNASNWLLFTPDLPRHQGLWQGLTLDEKTADDYTSYYHNKDLWYHAASRRGWLRGRSVFASDEIVPAQEYRNSEIYNDFLRREGMFHGCWSTGGKHVSPSTPLTVVGVYRPPTSPPFDGEDAARFRRLEPHLGRAFEVHWRLRCAERQRRLTLDTLDWLPSAVFLLSAAGRVLHENRAASVLLSRRDGLAIVNGQLASPDGDAANRLARVIGQAACRNPDDATASGGAFLVPRLGGQPPYQGLATPVPVENPLLLGCERVRAAVLLTDPETPIRPSLERLRAWFGLTAAEARVAADLAEGYSPGEIAQHSDISRTTVRTQLSAIYAKMGVTRQADLVRRILSVPRLAEQPGNNTSQET